MHIKPIRDGNRKCMTELENENKQICETTSFFIEKFTIRNHFFFLSLNFEVCKSNIPQNNVSLLGIYAWATVAVKKSR